MLRPTPGELIAVLRVQLRDEVLPVVPEGTPRRQLKAALHVLAQLEQTWDVQHSYLAADNADLRSALTELARLTDISPAPHSPAAQPVPGVRDEALRALVRESEALQADLDDLQQVWRATGRTDAAVDKLFFDLHVRMTERANAAAGVLSDR